MKHYIRVYIMTGVLLIILLMNYNVCFYYGVSTMLATEDSEISNPVLEELSVF